MKLPFSLFSDHPEGRELDKRVDLVRKEMIRFETERMPLPEAYAGISIPVDAAVLAKLLILSHREEPSSSETDG